jgi:DNA invertase Pin-like site-specific DNA recombinase
MTPKIPAGAWVRVSTGLQDEALQVPDVERYCADHGYTIVKRYELNDRSAFKGEQEEKQREALADVRSGKVRVVVAWASDRVERRGAESTLRIFRLFKDAGGRLESVQEPFLSSDNAELMQAITGWKDQQESQRKSERVGIGLAAIRANHALAGRAGYGFRLTGDKYSRMPVPFEPEAEVIREAVRRYLGGESLQQITDDLNARGVPSPTWKGQPGPCWYRRTLGDILRNPAIAGRRQDKARTKTVVRTEAIIPFTEWQRVQKRLDSRAHRKGVPSNSDKTAFLTSILMCGKCGGPMYRNHGRRGDYYYCRSGKGCKMLLDLAYVDAGVDAWIEREMSRRVFPQTVVVPGDSHLDEIGHLTQDIREMDPMADDFMERVAEKRAEIKRLSETATPDHAVTRDIPGSVVFAGWQSMPRAEKRKVILGTGLKVWATRDGDHVALSGNPPSGPETLVTAKESGE